jgi:hypothetical protein
MCMYVYIHVKHTIRAGLTNTLNKLRCSFDNVWSLEDLVVMLRMCSLTVSRTAIVLIDGRKVENPWVRESRY